MKRFLAGILSAVLLMGSIPVYGAQDMGISPEAGYSVEGTELSQTEEALSGENVPQEIMLSTRDTETGELLSDRITQEITDITAYYIGWLDAAPECIDEYLLVHSQHEYKNSKEKASQ